MRIAIIGSRGLYSNYSGVEKAVTELGKYLASKGHDVDVFAALDATNVTGVPGLRNRRTWGLSGKYTETISRSFLATLQCVGSRYDVINYHAVGSGILAPLGRISGGAIVVSLHGPDWKRAKWPLFAKQFLRLAGKTTAMCADEITVNSERDAQIFFEEFSRRPLVIPNGLPIRNETDTRVLADWGLKSKGYILFAARLVPEKAAHELISVFNGISTSFKLVVAGDNPYEPEYVASLKAAADPTKIVFTGHVSGKVLSTLFAEALLFVNCSYLEGMSLALMEALAYGVPALVSDIPENQSVIDQYGFTFRTGDMEDLGRELKNLLDDPEIVGKMVSRIADYLPTMMTWTDVAEKFEHLFIRVTADQQDCEAAS